MFATARNNTNVVMLDSHLFATVKGHCILNVTVINFKKSILNQKT